MSCWRSRQRRTAWVHVCRRRMRGVDCSEIRCNNRWTSQVTAASDVNDFADEWTEIGGRSTGPTTEDWWKRKKFKGNLILSKSLILWLFLRKVQLQRALSDEIQKRQNTEIIAVEHREVLTSTSLELKECKKFLTKECGINNHLKKELHQFKVSASAEWKVNTKVSSIIQS